MSASRLLASCALLTALTLPAVAQEEKPPEEGQSEGARGEDRSQRTRPGGGWEERVVEFLREELDLDAAQEKRVREVLSEAAEKAYRNMMRSWGNASEEDMKKAREGFEEMRVEISRKISEVLTPAQRREYEVLIAQFDRRAQSWEQSRRAWQDPSELFNPKPMSKRLLIAKAERSLFLGPEETAVVLPFVEAVIDARQALYEGRRVRRKDLLNAVSGGASPEEVRQRLVDIRTGEQLQTLALLAAQQELRDLLTLEQETRFVALGIME